jgi:hypothetical protein
MGRCLPFSFAQSQEVHKGDNTPLGTGTLQLQHHPWLDDALEDHEEAIQADVLVGDNAFLSDSNLSEMVVCKGSPMQMLPQGADKVYHGGCWCEQLLNIL